MTQITNMNQLFANHFLNDSIAEPIDIDIIDDSLPAIEINEKAIQAAMEDADTW